MDIQADTEYEHPTLGRVRTGSGHVSHHGTVPVLDAGDVWLVVHARYLTPVPPPGPTGFFRIYNDEGMGCWNYPTLNEARENTNALYILELHADGTTTRHEVNP